MAKRKKEQKDKLRYTKHTYKTKDRVTRDPVRNVNITKFLSALDLDRKWTSDLPGQYQQNKDPSNKL
jgi:hypothetical protein